MEYILIEIVHKKRMTRYFCFSSQTNILIEALLPHLRGRCPDYVRTCQRAYRNEGPTRSGNRNHVAHRQFLNTKRYF